MNENKMKFGKYKGEPVADIPVDYLAWAARKHKQTPGYILAELRARASRHGTRDAIEAESALSDYEFRTRPRRKKKRKKSKGQLTNKKAAKKRKRKYWYTKDFMPPRKRCS